MTIRLTDTLISVYLRQREVRNRRDGHCVRLVPTILNCECIVPGTSLWNDSPMGFTHWIFVQLPDVTFRYVGEGRFINFQLGKAVLPEVRPGEVRVVEVMLDLEDDLDPWLIHVEYRRYPVLASGYRDPASIELEHSLIRALVGMPSTVRHGSPEHRWAQQQTDNTFRWTPTAEEAHAIGDVVSRKAKRPVLGGRPLRLEPGTGGQARKPKQRREKT